MKFCCVRGGRVFVVVVIVVVAVVVVVEMMDISNGDTSLNVSFVHPDLGIGGAERLVVDAAMALQRRGHRVHIYTSHCDFDHAFEEVKKKQLPVTVWGDWIPRTLFFGRFHALMATLRMLWLSLCFLFFFRREDKKKDVPHVIFCDQISACVPVLRWTTGAKILFYIHFPDKLLAKPGSALKRCYRRPMDMLEESTTRAADLLVVNSRFTADVVKKHFPSIMVKPAVLYPTTYAEKQQIDTDVVRELVGRGKYFLSINRYEGKKNLPLALHAFHLLGQQKSKKKSSRNVSLGKGKEEEEDYDAECDEVKLVMAGGYDHRVEENVRVFEELEKEALEMENEENEENDDTNGNVKKKSRRVILLRNIDQKQKTQLMQQCVAVVYTPRDEHFGIVPLEAMALGRPVVASNTGGPTESVAHNQTGFLCQDTPEDFAVAMKKLLDDSKLADRMGNAGVERVKSLFGPVAFQKQLDEMVLGLANKKTKNE